MTYRRYRTMPPWRRAAAFLALLVAAVAAAAGARADEPGGAAGDYGPARIAEGVTVGGTLVGGMTGEQAATALRAAFRQPVTIAARGKTAYASPARAGGIPLVAPAVERALAVPREAAVPLQVLIDHPRLTAYSTQLARELSRPALNARARLRRLRPTVMAEQEGVVVGAEPVARVLGAALRTSRRGPLEVPSEALRPKVTSADVWPVIVIRRSANRLLFYPRAGRRIAFRVATGQPSYPTPLGHFSIVSRQLNPWWYPPDSDWARGLSPVPPGPGNPLGTRWMGLDRGGIGLHGTPDAASIGYSASHGCIRMRIPDAERLFERVTVGTTVFIVS